MGIIRNVLLWGSRSERLRNAFPRYSFVRKSVARFMPGEEIQDALDAAEKLKDQGMPTILTHLGENVHDAAETKKVAEHYLELLDHIHDRKLDSHISVKLTELGLDQTEELCFDNLKSLLEKAAALGNRIWIDMEASDYTTSTLEIFRKARSDFDNVGVCLQSYLYRSEEDLNQLMQLTPAIRLVKGAYAEPESIAYRKKADTDKNFFRMAGKLLSLAREGGPSPGIATHDQLLIRRVADHAERESISKESYEIQMLYGIRTADQVRLVKEGFRVRILISYGSYWFPWYMRRLAERPANIWFVLRNMF